MSMPKSWRFSRTAGSLATLVIAACSGDANRGGDTGSSGDTVLATPTFGPIGVPIGVALIDHRTTEHGRWCANFEEQQLAIGDTVMLIWPDSSTDTPEVLMTHVAGTRPGRCAQVRGDTADLDDPNFGTVHELALADSADSATVANLAGSPAMAIRGSARWTRGPDGFPRADLDGDENVEQARVCTSNEGIHLTLWTLLDTAGAGQPRDHRRWRMYQPLGYDVEPSCTARETDDPPSTDGSGEG